MKNNITKGVIALSALALLGGGMIAANAAAGNSSATGTAGFINIKHGSGRFMGRAGLGQGTPPTALTEAQKADLKAKTDAIKAALDSNNYNAWVAAETALNANSPILQKINSANFASYVQAYKLRVQADTIMQSLGITGMMKGDLGGHGGYGLMMGGTWQK